MTVRKKPKSKMGAKGDNLGAEDAFLPVIPINHNVLFPSMEAVWLFRYSEDNEQQRERVELIEYCAREKRRVAFLCQITDEDGKEIFSDIATIGSITQFTVKPLEDGTRLMIFTAKGMERGRVETVAEHSIGGRKYKWQYVAAVTPLPKLTITEREWNDINLVLLRQTMVKALLAWSNFLKRIMKDERVNEHLSDEQRKQFQKLMATLEECHIQLGQSVNNFGEFMQRVGWLVVDLHFSLQVVYLEAGSIVERLNIVMQYIRGAIESLSNYLDIPASFQSDSGRAPSVNSLKDDIEKLLRQAEVLQERLDKLQTGGGGENDEVNK